MAPNDGGGERQLTRLGLRPMAVSWNRDGTRLAFTADSGYRTELRYGASQIFTVAMDGKVQIPDAPGWGVEISKDWLSKASYQKSELA